MNTATIKFNARTGTFNKLVATPVGMFLCMLHNFREGAELEDEGETALAEKFERSGQNLRSRL